MWVQLQTAKRIEVRGQITQFHPGDWVEVGRHLGTAWIAAGEAKVQEFDPNDAVEGAGVIVHGNAALANSKLMPLKPTFVGIEYEAGFRIAFERTLFWDTRVQLRPELVHVGFALLDTWQMAVPFGDYKILAQHIGTEEEREQTKAVIRDLRVMLYDPRLICVRDTAETRALLQSWRDDVEHGGDERLALLRAIYRHKPLICGLPVTWTTPSYVA